MDVFGTMQRLDNDAARSEKARQVPHAPIFRASIARALLQVGALGALGTPARPISALMAN